jgi:hypothetical protein
MAVACAAAAAALVGHPAPAPLRGLARAVRPAQQLELAQALQLQLLVLWWQQALLLHVTWASRWDAPPRWLLVAAHSAPHHPLQHPRAACRQRDIPLTSCGCPGGRCC